MSDVEHWNIGGAAPGFAIITSVKHILDELGVTNIKISMYDHHFGLKWAGGRPHAIMPGQTKETFVAMVQEYNRRGISFNLAFSNLLVDKEHLDDKRCNWVLENCYRPGNGVIVTSHVLAEYIRERYPDYKLIHSLTHFNTDPAYFYDHAHLYDVFVLPPALNADRAQIEEFLTKLGRESIEIIVNETCFEECSYRKQHYYLISKCCLEDDWDLWENLVNNFCQRQHADRFRFMEKPSELLDVKTFTMTHREVDEMKALGITNFKLSSRQIPNQQYMRWIEYYILDRHDLTPTFSLYDNYYKPHHPSRAHM